MSIGNQDLFECVTACLTYTALIRSLIAEFENDPSIRNASLHERPSQRIGKSQTIFQVCFEHNKDSRES